VPAAGRVQGNRVVIGMHRPGFSARIAGGSSAGACGKGRVPPISGNL